ncbi:hypothetical protein DA798_02945 [Lactobacillus sp. PFC-70]|nr:hypothetical protein DA798_02945 [Lactobacillus sp. PFC-70]
MKKQAGIIIAIAVTLLTMGTAFVIQHYASANQPVAEQTVSSSSISRNDHYSANQSTSSSVTSQAQHSVKQVTKQSSRHKTTHERNGKQLTRQSKAQTVVPTRKQASSVSSSPQAKAASQATTKQTTKTTTSSQHASETVHLTVSGYKKTFFDGTVKINQHSTAFSVLQASKLKINYQNGVAVYVSSINGLAENEVKVGSGWKFKVNGKFIDKGANKEPVSNHDRVHWYFTTKGY